MGEWICKDCDNAPVSLTKPCEHMKATVAKYHENNEIAADPAFKKQQLSDAVARHYGPSKGQP